ncbi:MAG: hypothetical protein J3K34DRAFT_422182 [Monoraphidium minutum]|nr:MAG: hypothetical protein J3K34DRAFT_422182 [Monoraphidium minutum]
MLAPTGCCTAQGGGGGLGRGCGGGGAHMGTHIGRGGASGAREAKGRKGQRCAAGGVAAAAAAGRRPRRRAPREGGARGGGAARPGCAPRGGPVCAMAAAKNSGFWFRGVARGTSGEYQRSLVHTTCTLGAGGAQALGTWRGPPAHGRAAPARRRRNAGRGADQGAQGGAGRSGAAAERAGRGRGPRRGLAGRGPRAGRASGPAPCAAAGASRVARGRGESNTDMAAAARGPPSQVHTCLA